MEQQVTTAAAHDGSRSVAAGACFDWLARGVKLVLQAPGFWILGGLIIVIVSQISSRMSMYVGALATAFNIVATGAAMRACGAIEAGRDPVQEALGALKIQPLLILGAIAGGLTLAIVMAWDAIGTTTVGAAILSGSAGSAGMAFMGVVLSVVAISLVFIVFYMTLWLAPALVVFDNLHPIDALKGSFNATRKNLLAYIMLVVLVTIAYFIGAGAMLLGLLVVIPASMCTCYAAYQDLLAKRAP